MFKILVEILTFYINSWPSLFFSFSLSLSLFKFSRHFKESPHALSTFLEFLQVDKHEMKFNIISSKFWFTEIIFWLSELIHSPLFFKCQDLQLLF